MNHIKITENEIKIFNKLIKDKKVIILFYMNNCSHCEILRPIWEKVLQKLSNKNINIYEIEYSNVSKLPSKFRNIIAYPSIVSYDNGEYKKDFTDKRTIKNVEKFILENII